MASMFAPKMPQIQMPQIQKAPPLPDPNNPQALAQAKLDAASRAGRASTQLTTAAGAPGSGLRATTLAQGGSPSTYSGTTLGNPRAAA